MKHLAKLALASFLALTSLCGCSSSTEQSSQSSEVSYRDSLELIDALYENMKSDEMPSIVGGYGEDMTEGEPASLDTQSETAAQAFAIPLDVLNEAVSAACFSHALMTNNLSVVVLEFANGTDLEDLAEQIETQVKDNQWICSIPEKAEIEQCGNYLLYAFGSSDLLSVFHKACSELTPAAREISTISIK